ncbi:MAG: ABC transporter ATP-binding protein [Bacteroidales bacterium]
MILIKSPGMSLPVIDIKNLTKRYGKARGIESVSLSISEGEIFGFIGPNGAGKSTTIRLLLNLIFPTSGSASILGMDMISQTKEIKKHLGYVPSEASAYSSMTVNEFLDYSGRFYGAVSANERKLMMCDLFELDLKRKLADLSTGNKRKVAIVQSLLHSPRLLIVDEPTTGLDPLIQARFFDLLREENKKGLTIFYSSHVLSEIQMLCGRVAIIRDGRIVKVEEIETLRRKQLKRVTVEMEGGASQRLSGLKGVRDFNLSFNNSANFMFSGDVNELLTLLEGTKLLNLTIEEPPLEEIFMHYYNNNGNRV